MLTISEMRQDLLAQEAWGKRNTAPLSNRIRAARRAQMPLLLRAVHALVDTLVLWGLLLAGFLLKAEPLLTWLNQ